MTDRSGTSSFWLFLIGSALVVLTAAGATLLDSPWSRRVAWFMVTLCVASALWLLAVLLVRRDNPSRGAIWIVLAVAAAMRLVTFATPVLLSTDIYRYVWDGRVQRAGVNPYRYLPDAPRLNALRDQAVYPHINRAKYAHTIYPPAAEVIFGAAAFVAPGVRGMKAVMGGFDVLAIGCLAALLRLTRRNPADLLIYAWLPLPVWEFAGSGHIDAAATGLMALALLLSARGRPVLLGVTLAAATFTKFLPGAVLPVFWRDGRWRVLFGFVVAAVALYLPYVGVGRGIFGFLAGYTAEEGLRDGRGVFLLDLLSRFVSLPRWATAGYFAVVITLLTAMSVRIAFGGAKSGSLSQHVERQAGRAAMLGAVLLVAMSPHYPWYFSWLAPMVCVAPLASVMWLLAAAPLLAHGSVDYLIVPLIVYVPAGILAVHDIRQACASTKLDETDVPEETE